MLTLMRLMEETLTSNDKLEAINGDGEMPMIFPIYIHGEMAFDISYPRG